MSANTPTDQTPWWDKLPPQIGGDAIVANIGNNAQGVAVGKNIQQQVASALGPPTPSDKQFIERRLDDLDANIKKMHGQLDEATAKVAELQVKLLRGELTKTEEKQTPSAETIMQAGDWLLDNIPSLAETVVGLFATPPVGKVVGKAGEMAIKWARQRLGGAAKPPQ